MNKSVIDPGKLLTPQEHLFMGSTVEAKVEGSDDFYRPFGVLKGGISTRTAELARESLGTYPFGLMEVVIGRQNVVIRLQKIDSKTGMTLKDPELGFLDEKGRFVYDGALTNKLYKLSRENNIDLRLREVPPVLEGEFFGAENKG